MNDTLPHNDTRKKIEKIEHDHAKGEFYGAANDAIDFLLAREQTERERAERAEAALTLARGALEEDHWLHLDGRRLMADGERHVCPGCAALVAMNLVVLSARESNNEEVR